MYFVQLMAKGGEERGREREDGEERRGEDTKGGVRLVGMGVDSIF